MCAINPKFQMSFIIRCFTAHGTKEDFESRCRNLALEAEQMMNAVGDIRAHVEENVDETPSTKQIQPRS